MSRSHLKLVILAVACLLLAGSSLAAAASVPHQVRVGTAARLPTGSSVIGSLPSTTAISVTVVLKPRDPAGLRSYATAVSTPGSSVYHRYLSVAEFRQLFSPTEAQVTAVAASLRARGLKPGPVSANGLAIPVTSTAGAVGRAFSTSFRRVTVRGGRTAFANTAAPLLDSSVAGVVQGVIGLDSVSVPRPLGLRAAHARGLAVRHVVTGGPQPCSNASSSGFYTADQIASAYRFSSLYGTGDKGAGQTIALYELEPNLGSDISAYQSCYGTSASVNYISVDGGSGTGAGQGEAALDIEQMIGLAPKATVDVYRAPNSGSGPYDEYSKIITTNVAKVISTSWGLCEAQIGPTAASAENTLFQEAATQGQSIFAAAGDTGSEDCGDGSLAVDDPGSQPFVTSVGGTTMFPPGPPPSESVWNDSYGSGGGGVSALWGMPSFQSGAPSTLNVINAHSSGTPCGAASGTYCREVPDVSADADPSTGYAIRFHGSWVGFGGTSAGAPLWGALTALVNTSSACGGSPIGFANPPLYAAAGGAYASNFNDITSGNNDSTGTSGGLYRAGTAYDVASGLGTPNAAGLATWLCAAAVIVATPGAQRSVVGLHVSRSISAHNPSGKPLSYAATGLPAGLSINSRSGLISGTPTAAGANTVTVYASESAGGLGSVRFSWIVDPVTVSVSYPGNQKSAIGAAVRLRIGAGDNDGGALRFGAYGLPRGLSINGSTGLITGKPSNGGRFSVAVMARDASASGSTRFTWTIKGPGTFGASLSGVAGGKPKLAFRLSAVGDSPAARSVVIALPSGLSFSRSVANGITLAGSNGRRVKGAQLRIVGGGRLKITVAKGSGQVRFVIAPAALRASQALISSVKRRQAGPLVVTVRVTDSKGHTTALTLVLKPG